MPGKIAKYFIITSICFFIIGCIEGMMFPTKFMFQSFYSSLFQIQPEHIKTFFGYFVAKIHTHVNLIGWVGSALMGILYYLVPEISHNRNYYPWAAWGNWFCHTAGTLCMAAGFHLIGVFGIGSGFAAGSPEFRAAVAPFKTIVAIGGVLVTLSAILFAINMLRCLLARDVTVKEAVSGHTGRLAGLKKAGIVTLVALTAGITAVGIGSADASPSLVPEKVDVIIIGDRVVDIAVNLGVAPVAMSVRCAMWPMCGTLKTTSQVLGCPNCLFNKKCKPLFEFAEKHGIKRVIIETGNPFCSYMPEVNPKDMAPLLISKGMTVDIVDVSDDLGAAVRKIAQLLGRESRADELLANYDTELKKTKDAIAEKTYARTVVIINGVLQEATGKSFLRIEAPGGYADQLILSGLNCKNAGDRMVVQEAKASKGHFSIRNLNSLSSVAPEAIIMTGDAVAVQKALSRAIAGNPALENVPAIKSGAVYSLPGFINSSVVEYPKILRQWAYALEK